MSSDFETITISLLGKKYQVSCEESEVATLEKSAKYLSKKMAEIRDTGRVVGLDRIAVMAALNIIGESVVSQEQLSLVDDELDKRVEALSSQRVLGKHSDQTHAARILESERTKRPSQLNQNLLGLIKHLFILREFLGCLPVVKSLSR